MSISVEAVLELLEAYCYVLLFPPVLLEGPTFAVAAGLLDIGGLMSWPVAYAVADLTGEELAVMGASFVPGSGLLMLGGSAGAPGARARRLPAGRQKGPEAGVTRSGTNDFE